MQLFPKEIIEHSVEHHFWTHSVRSQVLYSSVLAIILIMVSVLPFIYIDVSVRSQGIIRPISERKVLSSPVSGNILELNITENKTYHKGEIIARIGSPLLLEQLQFNKKLQKRMEAKRSDLYHLVDLDTTNLLRKKIRFQLPRYEQQFYSFRKELLKQLSEIENRHSEFSRNKHLYDKKVLSFVEFDKSRYALKTARNQYQILLNQQIDRWQTELEDVQTKYRKLQSKEQQLLEEIAQYTIKMPLTGTIQNIAGISEGSYVQVQQQLAEISPDTGLIAEIYVTPQDIGLIKKGMLVRFQVDAFDYNQWGTLKGIVTDISKDVITNENQSYFKIRTTLSKSYMQLPNGYKGKLKKGMTLQARFRITRRSLFQLLYDNVDDWLNPNWDQEQSIAQN